MPARISSARIRDSVSGPAAQAEQLGEQLAQRLLEQGAAGMLAALEAGKVVATANKETLVSAGHLVMPLASARAAAVASADQADPEIELLAALGAAAGIASLLLAPASTAKLGPGTVSLRAECCGGGETELLLPPVGSISAATHRASLSFVGRVEEIVGKDY